MTGRFRTGCFLPRVNLPRTHVPSPTSPPSMRSAAGIKHVTLMLLWDEYKQAYPEGYQYSQFC